MGNRQVFSKIVNPILGYNCPHVNPPRCYNPKDRQRMDSNMNGIWGLRIRSLRTRRGMSRHQLSEATGVAADTINRMERQEVRNPREDKRKQIADHFGVSEEYLMTGQPHAPGDPQEDILDDPLSAGRVVIKPKDPFSKSVTLSESRDGENDARLLMEIAQETNENIKRLVFNGDLPMDKAVKIYALVYQAVTTAHNLK